MRKICNAILKLIIVLLVFVAGTFAIYWFNADMKLVRIIYDKMQPHYDNLQKDRKL